MNSAGTAQTPCDVSALAELLEQLPPETLNALITLAGRTTGRSSNQQRQAQEPRISSPLEGLPYWLAKMKSERYSEGSIFMYRYHVVRYLRRDPFPTKLSVQSYLADKLAMALPKLYRPDKKTKEKKKGGKGKDGKQ